MPETPRDEVGQGVGAPGLEMPAYALPTEAGESENALSRIPSADLVHTGESVWATIASAADGSAGSGLSAVLEGRFEVLGKIGEGGMGKIFFGRDRALRRTVAIKELRHDLLTRLDAVERFRSEAQIVAQLEHPGIVPIYAAEQRQGGAPAFSMKFVRGRTLADYLSDCVRNCRDREDPSREFARSSRLEIFVKVCEAVAFAHSRGVVHRDIKPENIMIGTFGEVYVMDWGVARLASRAADREPSVRPSPGAPFPEAPDFQSAASTAPDLGAMDTRLGTIRAGASLLQTDGSSLETQYGEVVGTLTHMPPEQARGDIDAVGPGSDQFALGMILFEMVALRPPRPFDGDARKMLDRAVAGRVARLEHRYGRRIPASLAAIVDRCLQVEPAQRYPSVLDLAEDVARFSRGEEVSVRPDNVMQRAGRWMARYPSLVLAAVLVLVVSAGVIVVKSLLDAVEAQATAGRQSQQLAELTNYVAAAAHDLDTSAMQVKLLVEGLASEVGARLSVPLDDEVFRSSGLDEQQIRMGKAYGDWSFAPDFDGTSPPATAYASPRYGRPISFETPSYWIAATADHDAAARDLVTLADVDTRMRDMVVRTVDPAQAAVDSRLQARLLREETGRFQFVYVGLESGLLLNFPGVGGFAADYDPRQRPWYKTAQARALPGASFGTPYPDVAGTGLLLPCNAPIRDDKDRFLGVAGGDVRMMGIARFLRMDQSIPRLSETGERAPLRGWKHGAIVDDEGRVVVDSAASDVRSGGTHDNRTIERIAYPNPKVVQQVRASSSGVLVVDGEDMFATSRLNALGWYLVIRVSGAAYSGEEG